jgi:arsenite methyltransferase
VSDIREEVREKYARAVTVVTEEGKAAEDSCCGDLCGCGEQVFGSGLYENDDRSTLPEEALLASMGCGNPTAVADLREGETVLDLGSGGGIDVLLSAKRVGAGGKVYGLDMTDEMLALALANKAKSGVENVEFLKGYIEAIPLPAATVDVIISNCVINLAADKPAVFAEMYRVLRPGGRIGISDVVAEDGLTPEQRAERGSYVGCIAGALSFIEYEEQLKGAGFEDVTITSTHEVTEGMTSAIIKAMKPASLDLPMIPSEAVSNDSCC